MEIDSGGGICVETVYVQISTINSFVNHSSLIKEGEQQCIPILMKYFPQTLLLPKNNLDCTLPRYAYQILNVVTSIHPQIDK